MTYANTKGRKTYSPTWGIVRKPAYLQKRKQGKVRRAVHPPCVGAWITKGGKKKGRNERRGHKEELRRPGGPSTPSQNPNCFNTKGSRGVRKAARKLASRNQQMLSHETNAVGENRSSTVTRASAVLGSWVKMLLMVKLLGLQESSPHRSCSTATKRPL